MKKNIFKKASLALSFVSLFLCTSQISAKYLAIGGRNVIQVYKKKNESWKNAQLKKVFKLKHGGVYSVAFSPQGKYLAAASNYTKSSLPPVSRGIVTIWDMKIDKEKIVHIDNNQFAFSVTFSPQGKFLAAVFADGTTRIWDTNTWILQQELKSKGRHNTCSLAFSPTGEHLVVGGHTAIGGGIGMEGWQNKLWVWDTRSWALKKELTTKQAGGSSPYSVAFTPQGDYLAAAYSHSGTIVIWNAKTWQPLKALRVKKSNTAGRGFVTSVAFSQNEDGHYLASASDPSGGFASDNSDILIWKKGNKGWKNSRLAKAFKANKDPNNNFVAFDPDGNYLASGSGNRIVLFKTQNGTFENATIERIFNIQSAKAIAFVPKPLETEKEKMARQDLEERIKYLRNELGRLQKMQQLSQQNLKIQLKYSSLKNIPKIFFPANVTDNFNAYYTRD